MGEEFTGEGGREEEDTGFVGEVREMRRWRRGEDARTGEGGEMGGSEGEGSVCSEDAGGAVMAMADRSGPISTAS